MVMRAFPTVKIASHLRFKSDETSCEQKCTNITTYSVSTNAVDNNEMFYCDRDDKCISKMNLCDGNKDCSDEYQIKLKN